MVHHKSFSDWATDDKYFWALETFFAALTVTLAVLSNRLRKLGENDKSFNAVTVLLVIVCLFSVYVFAGPFVIASQSRGAQK